MNFAGKMVLVFLEEDNIQRAYFRIRPLLTQEGPVDKQAVSEFPDEGYLRIVPDKNEQHTFKERMRTLCGLCVLNLRDMPPEVSKIRTNKNYAPARGENNQYIVYSDAVQPMPKDAFYQVVAEDQLASALTPMVFTRSGAHIQGPFDSTTHQSTGPVEQVAPDSSALYTVTLPDDRELLFYCPHAQKAAEDAPEKAEHVKENAPAEEAKPAEEAPAPKEEPREAAKEEPKEENTKPVSPWKKQLDAIMAGEKPRQEAPPKTDMQSALQQIQQLNGELNVASRLKEEHKPFQAPQQLQPQQPLGGTKLYQAAPQKKNQGMKAHNPLTETVDMQRNPNRYESRYEAPGAVIAQNAQMNDVANPVEHFRHALQKAWNTPDTHRQVISSILGIHGIRPALSKALCEGKQDLTVMAMHSQLQELEAERLMTIMQLDDAKAARQKIKDEVIAAFTRQEKATQEKLEAITREKQHCVDEMTRRQEALILECENVQKQLDKLPWQEIIAPKCGAFVTEQELMDRMQKCLKAAGFKAFEDDVRALLITLALTGDTVSIAADTRADAKAAADAIAAALGTSCHRIHASHLSVDPVRVLDGGDAPVFTCDTESLSAPIKNSTHMVLCDKQMNPLAEEGEVSDCYYAAPWLEIQVETDDEALPKQLPVYPAVSMTCLRSAMLRDGETGDTVRKLISTLCQTLRSAGAAMPLALRSKLAAFILAGQNTMKGGVAAAIDYAVRAVVLPHVEAYALEKDVVRPALQAMPRALKGLGE